MLRLVLCTEDVTGAVTINSQVVTMVKTFDVHLPEVEQYIRNHLGIRFLSCKLVGAELFNDPEPIPHQPS